MPSWTRGAIVTDLSWVRRFPDTCDTGVVRKGEDEPCGKPAVAVRTGSEWAEEYGPDLRPWPVCAHHARGVEMVPLRELLEGEPGG